MPVNWSEHIVTTPDIQRGKLRIKATRIPVSLILAYLTADKTADEIMRKFPPLSKEQILPCVDYARAIS